MKKWLKILLKTIGVLLFLLISVMIIGWFYLKSTFLDFEDAYAEKPSFNRITQNGYTFIDRNGNEQLDAYEDERRTTPERVSDLLSLMTIEEKIHLLKGSGIASAIGIGDPQHGIPGAVGTIVPTPRLGLPAIYLSDGPAGLRIQPTRKNEDRTYYCTAFPIGTLLASTWNTELVEEVGSAMGNEALEYGIDVILGPGANIHRHPFCGRNFEYYSEDPVLTGFIGAAMVNGIESQGVGSSVKHFVANNQETNRKNNDAVISDRAMREIYLKGFEIITKKSQPWTIMSSYNKVNGTYTSESKELLTGVLRNDWGFEGLVMSDWFGGNNAFAMIKAGNDLLEPGTKTQWKALTSAYEEATLTREEIDVSAGRILALILKSRKMKNSDFGNNPDLKAHAGVTRQTAAEGMVLLKNKDVLPLKANCNVALLGVTSYDFIAGGTGSGDVNEAYTVSLEEGLRNSGFEINTFASKIFEDHKASNKKAFVKPEGIMAMFTPYKPPEIAYLPDQLEEIAGNSDIGIITIGRNSGEGGDRKEEDDFLLTSREKEMIYSACSAFHKVGKKCIIVLNIGGVIETASWKNVPDGILLAWQGGQEGGSSAADILSGKTNPSGKLPMTFPVNLQDHASNANFPQDGKPMKLTDLLSAGKTNPENKRIRNIDYTIYEEGIYVGYRHFDKAEIGVSYPFGYGLSYTQFKYKNLNVAIGNDTINIGIEMENSGKRAGKEVVQIYTSKPNSAIDRPIKELKSFTKTRTLSPGESQQIFISIPVSDLEYWDEQTSEWKLEHGVYSIQAGSSSREIKLNALIVI